MTMTIHLTWWMIPTLITVLSFSWALYGSFGDDAPLSSQIGSLFACIPASLITAIAWIIGAFFK